MDAGEQAAFEAIEARVQGAENAFGRGDYAGAFDRYRDILADRLAADHGDVRHLRAADLVIIERLADLTALFGMFAVADDLLSAMVSLTRAAGNDLAADYAQMKRVELALARGGLADAFDRLAALKPRIGDITAIDMSTAGLARWEQAISWREVPSADREVLF